MNNQISSNTYTVQKGDSLYKIAQKFDTTPEALMEINQLQNNLLEVGQILQISNPFPTPSHIGKDICPPFDENKWIDETEKYDTYIVKPGDSLYKIANQFHTNIGNISYINNLKNTLLMIGQKLLVPKADNKQNLYIVKAGDSLWSIANKYNISVQQLKTENNLSKDMLAIGQTLIIPSPTSTPSLANNQYQVKAGDSLWSIAQKFHTTPAFLMEKNKLNNTLLMIGQTLIVQ